MKLLVLQLSGILDCIALRTLSLVKHPAQAAAHPAPPTQAAVKLLVESVMELDDDTTSDAGTGMELVSLWNEVQHILHVLFEELPDDMVGSTLPSLRRLAGRGSHELPTKEEEERKKEKMFQMILKKICALLLQVLNGVCVEQLVRVVEPLHHQVREGTWEDFRKGAIDQFSLSLSLRIWSCRHLWPLTVCLGYYC